MHAYWIQYESIQNGAYRKYAYRFNLNLLCKSGCKFTTVTKLHIQEKTKTRKIIVIIYRENKLTITQRGGHNVPVFLVSTSCTDLEA